MFGLELYVVGFLIFYFFIQCCVFVMRLLVVCWIKNGYVVKKGLGAKLDSACVLQFPGVNLSALIPSASENAVSLITVSTVHSNIIYIYIF